MPLASSARADLFGSAGALPNGAAHGLPGGCMLRRRAVSDTLRSHSSKTRWMCSQRTRSADMGSSGGSGVPSSWARSRLTASASAGFGR